MHKQSVVKPWPHHYHAGGGEDVPGHGMRYDSTHNKIIYKPREQYCEFVERKDSRRARLLGSSAVSDPLVVSRNEEKQEVMTIQQCWETLFVKVLDFSQERECTRWVSDHWLLRPIRRWNLTENAMHVWRHVHIRQYQAVHLDIKIKSLRHYIESLRHDLISVHRDMKSQRHETPRCQKWKYHDEYVWNDSREFGDWWLRVYIQILIPNVNSAVLLNETAR